MFCSKLGSEFVARFSNDMQQIFGKDIKVGCKDSVPRIAEKIHETMDEHNIPASEAWTYLTDILRFQIFCRTPDDVKEVF
jgi:hypothetical protein